MVLNRLPEGQVPDSKSKTNRFQRDIPKAQETIYNYLLDIVKNWAPDDVLKEFKHLFIHHVNTISSHTLPSLYEIVFANKEVEFRNTLKRSCYILINNWDITRNHPYIQQLIETFDDPIIDKQTMSPTLKRLRTWLRNFIDSEDFEALKLFASKYETQGLKHWSERYTAYLLVPQYIDLNNPSEQRHAARALSKQLKEKFKFDLALFTARSSSEASLHPTTQPRNPTTLGSEALRLVKLIVARQGKFSYANLAHIFLQQTQSLSYKDFKLALRKYLLFSITREDFIRSLKKQLDERLDSLYVDYNDTTINDALLLRTTNRVIEFLTTENHKEPSALFVQILSHGNPLLLVVLLLKLVLICPYARTHLEARIADLVQYYKDYPEEDCRWVINFFEVFDISMAIYAENIEFNLVSIKDIVNTKEKARHLTNLDQFRVFSQMRKQNADSDATPDAVEIALMEALAVDDESMEMPS